MRFYRHDFGDNRTLDYVVRLAEIIRRYESLVDALLASHAPYRFGGDLTLAAWLEQVEAGIVAAAVQQCQGVQAKAMRLLGESSRRHFGAEAQRRIRYAHRTFAQVAASRTRSGNQTRDRTGPSRRKPGVA